MIGHEEFEENYRNEVTRGELYFFQDQAFAIVEFFEFFLSSSILSPPSATLEYLDAIRNTNQRIFML
jgi:hypothetical protein